MPIPTGDAALLFADDLEALAPTLIREEAAPSSGARASSSDGLSREERERLIERARLRQAERSRVAIAETDGGPPSAGDEGTRRARREDDDEAASLHTGLAGLRPQLDARRPHTSEEVGRLVERLVHQELTRNEPSAAPHEAPRSPLPSSDENQQLVVGRLVSLHERLAARAAARIEAEGQSTDASSADERGTDRTARRRRRRRHRDAVGSAAVWMRRHPTGDADMRIRHGGAVVELGAPPRMIFSELAMQAISRRPRSRDRDRTEIASTQAVRYLELPRDLGEIEISRSRSHRDRTHTGGALPRAAMRRVARRARAQGIRRLLLLRRQGRAVR